MKPMRLIVGSLLFLLCSFLSIAFYIAASEDYVSRFGRRYLREPELVAEVTVGPIQPMGMGVDVVSLSVEKIFLNRLPEDLARSRNQVMLAYRGEYREDTRLLLFLKRFGTGDRLTAVHRLSHLEKYYADKVRLIEQYIEIEKIKKAADKQQCFVLMVLRNLGDESYWFKWNSLYELRGVLESRSWTFTTGDVAHIKKIEEETDQVDFQRALADVRGKMEKEAQQGPSILEGRKRELKNKQ